MSRSLLNHSAWSILLPGRILKAALLVAATLYAATAMARPAVQSKVASDDDATLVLSVLDSAIRGDQASWCSLRFMDSGDQVVWSTGDHYTLSVFEDDVVGDDLIWSKSVTIDAATLAAGTVDRSFDCSAWFHDDEDAYGVELYAQAKVIKDKCGTFCMYDEPQTDLLTVAIFDDDLAEDDNDPLRAWSLLPGLNPDRVAADSSDWSSIALDTAQQDVSFRVEYRNEAGPLLARPYDSDHSTLLGDLSASADALALTTSLSAGVYYLKVWNSLPGDPNFYDIRVDVAPADGVPVISAGGSVNYIEGDEAVVVNSGLRVDDDGSQMPNARLRIGDGFVSGEDQLELDDLGGQRTVQWDAVNGVLNIDLPGNAAACQAALRSVKYRNLAGDNPSPGARKIYFRVSDGQHDSAEADSLLVVRAVNDLPYFVEPTPTGVLAVQEGHPISFTLHAEDPEGDPLSYGGLGFPDSASLDSDSGQFDWTPTWQQAGRWSLRLTVSDGQGTAGADLVLVASAIDNDDDAVPDGLEAQLGLDSDSPDSDGDNISDSEELGILGDPRDSDGDGTIDALDTDSDDDGISDSVEAGDENLATPARDSDQDGTPDYLDTDSDDDGVDDKSDNCRVIANADQQDSDDDGIGDACDGQVNDAGTQSSDAASAPDAGLSDQDATTTDAGSEDGPAHDLAGSLDDSGGCQCASHADKAPLKLWLWLLVGFALWRRQRK